MKDNADISSEHLCSYVVGVVLGQVPILLDRVVDVGRISASHITTDTDKTIS